MDADANRLVSAPVRLDKWLWYARFFKTRSLATKLISSGKLRINGEVTSKPHRQALIGQVLTFAQGPYIRVIRIDEIGKCRGPVGLPRFRRLAAARLGSARLGWLGK